MRILKEGIKGDLRIPAISGTCRAIKREHPLFRILSSKSIACHRMGSSSMP